MKISFKVAKLKLFRRNWWSLTKKEWLPQLMTDNKELWPRQVDADGKPWKTLSPSYRKWKSEVYGAVGILRATGEMEDRSYLTLRGNKFAVNTNDEGIYNQFGTDRMPARPWMGVPAKSLNSLSEISLKNILQ